MFNPSTLTRRLRVASALSMAALLGVGLWAPAQAAPDPNPPAIANNDRNRQGDRARADALRGTVDRVFSARSFDLRADDGRVYRVNLRVPVGLQTQSQVRVRGDLNGSTFDARAITIGDFADDRYDDGYGDDGYGNGNGNGNGNYNNGGYNNGGYGNGVPNNGNGGYNPGAPNYQGQQVTLRGRITRFLSRTDFEVRDDDDGRIYRVRTDAPLSYNVREGDRIEAVGELNGATIRANSAVGIGNTGVGNVPSNGNNGNAIAVDFSGPIVSLDLNREEATVRAGNGYIYTLRARRATLNNFRVGQRVQVRGNWINERVEVTSLSRE